MLRKCSMCHLYDCAWSWPLPSPYPLNHLFSCYCRYGKRFQEAGIWPSSINKLGIVCTTGATSAYAPVTSARWIFVCIDTGYLAIVDRQLDRVVSSTIHHQYTTTIFSLFYYPVVDNYWRNCFSLISRRRWPLLRYCSRAWAIRTSIIVLYMMIVLCLRVANY